MAGAPANEVFAGPNGSDGTPTFRKLVNADLPGGGGGGTDVEVNSGGTLTTANINATTPAAPSGDLNATPQVDGSGNVSLYLPPFGASGASHAPGLVPDPGATAGTAKFLREDATWDVPSGSSGVTSLDSITGAVVLTAGTGITITDNSPSAGDITIAATGGGGGSTPWSALAPATVVPPVLADFTATATPSTSGATQGTNNVYVYFSNPPASNEWATWLKAYPSTPFTVTMGFVMAAVSAGSPTFAICVSDGTKYVTHQFRYTNNSSAPQLGVGYWTNSTTYNSQPYLASWVYQMPIAWLYINDDGTNLNFGFLPDGQNKVQLYTASRTAFLTPSYLGFGIVAGGAGSPLYATIVHWSD